MSSKTPFALGKAFQMKAMIKILVIVILAQSLSSCQTGEQEIVIVPTDYTGYIVIIHNQEHGNPIRYEGKKRVYEIPQSGILRTQFSGNYGWVGLTEFYYESIAQEKQIPFKVDADSLPSDSIVAFGGSTGKANKDLEGKETVEFKLFYVGTKEQIDKAYEEAEKLNIVKLAE